MKSKDDLLQQWGELTQFWRDDAARSFENQHLKKIIECMEEIEREYGKFRRCSDEGQGA